MEADVDDVRNNVVTMMMDPNFHIKTDDLSSVPSKNEGGRRSYLEKNILERYYPRNDNMKLLYVIV